MAVDFSKNVFDLFSGKKRIRLLPTLAIAFVVTGLVAVPLTYRAVDSRNNPVDPEVVLAPADAAVITVDTATTERMPLDLATVEGSILISVSDASAQAVSFSLFAADSDQAIVESVDLEGPQFDLIVSESGGGSPFDSTMLQNGRYELFVTIRMPNEDQRTAVGFEIENP